MTKVYFDNAATTQVRPEVIRAITDVLGNSYGNASSSYSFGRASKVLLEQARRTVAKTLNVSDAEIVFTSGGTEANNLILRGAIRDLGIKHIITSKIEHHAVLNTVNQLEKEYDIAVNYVNLDGFGSVDLPALNLLLEASKEKTLVSLMHINNEIGNVLDIKQVSTLCKQYDALFHTDAVQSVGHYKLDLKDIPVDFLSASAHKFYGPKGVGLAYVKKDLALQPLILGGEQERGLRAGTEAIHNIVGLETAIKLCYDNLESDYEHITSIKSYFIDSIKKGIPEAKFNGLSSNFDKSSYAIINVCLPISQEKSSLLLFQLDLKGIACSKGSACQSGSNQKSHVLAEILNNEDLSKTSLRFSFSIYNTIADVDYVVNILKELV